ncbi:hypothetical protein PMAC_003135 [Pneumocystis sp. 'macacae']|nr:hypothetical protein PMAC_003135 [Pneumocystis sp. 'macacae']
MSSNGNSLKTSASSFFFHSGLDNFAHESHKARDTSGKKHEYLDKPHKKGLTHSQSVAESLVSGHVPTGFRSASLVQLMEESSKKGFFGRLMRKKSSKINLQKLDTNDKNEKPCLYSKKMLSFTNNGLKDYNSYKDSLKSFSTPISESISSYKLTRSVSTPKGKNPISLCKRTLSFLGNTMSSQTVSDNTGIIENFQVRTSFESYRNFSDTSSGLKHINDHVSSSVASNKANMLPNNEDKENTISDRSKDFEKSISQLNQSITEYSELSFVSAREIFDNKNSLTDVFNKDIKDYIVDPDSKNYRSIDELTKSQTLKYSASIIGKSIFRGEETYISRIKAATWLGDCSELNSNVRTVYMNQFDWTGVDILTALRRLCSKLIMKAETQQMDRILESFSKRWYECNSSSKFTPDIVHPIAYSLLLLNTDLHVADLTQGQKMTKNQFVQNTLSTIFSSYPRSKLNISQFSGLSLMDSSISLVPTGHALSQNFLSYNRLSTDSRFSLDISKKVSNKFLINKASSVTLGDELNNSIYFQLEALLKEMYISVKNSHILQPVVNDNQSNDVQDINSIYKMANSDFYPMSLDQTLSLSCGSLSETSTRKYRTGKFRIKSWGNKKKNISQICHDNYSDSISCNINDWSPGFGNKSNNFSSENRSVCSFNSSCYSTNTYDYQFTTIGFAGTLNSVMKKTSTLSSTSLGCNYDAVEENELALSGPPWTKEGILKHKHYLENFKKAKNRAWVECFSVLEKGKLKLFQFNNNKFSERKGVIGSGNWIENADIIGSFILLQSLASALPPPGYSPTRPYVWVLTLPNGSVHFFQVGTSELLNEWVYTANYWAARLSKEPLLGGISNVEYGWGQCLEEMENYRKKTKEDKHVSKLPGDKAIIKTWNTPQLYLLTNTTKEEEQVKNLRNYISILEKDVQKHNAYRPQILQAFSPRHPNLAKALLNWERKSQYLLREIVKYKTYLECLSRALVLRNERLSKNSIMYNNYPNNK